MAAEWLNQVITGAVGVAGIFGTGYAARQARKAQTESALVQAHEHLVAEKRALYSEFLRAVGDAQEAGRRTKEIKAQLTRLLEEGPAQGQDIDRVAAELKSQENFLRNELPAINRRMQRYEAEISVLGGPKLGILAMELTTAVSREAQLENDETSGTTAAMQRMTFAMHADIDPNESRGARLARLYAFIGKEERASTEEPGQRRRGRRRWMRWWPWVWIR